MAKAPTKVIYIAGPYRAANEWGVNCNIRAAEAAALAVWRLGEVALCPHKNTAFFGGAADDSLWLAGDLVLLARCDAVLLVEGWETSSGTIDEVIFAINRRIPVFTNLNSLAVWKYHETVIEVQSETQAKALQLRDARRAKAGA
jgi:nucleoside 2-deoxyribosyltransferase